MMLWFLSALFWIIVREKMLILIMIFTVLDDESLTSTNLGNDLCVYK